MLKINRLHIEIKTDNLHQGGIYGFDASFTDGLNFIASSENTSGKSSVIEAIIYCLGLEQIIGGKNEHVLTSAYKTQIKDEDKTWNVLESGAFLEISNGKEVVTIFRTIVKDGRDPRLVTVYKCDYESIGKMRVDYEDMYLHDGGAATNERGFHNYLESFLQLKLPVVQTSGNDQKLYLQTIFSGLFIEQKHGWADIFSGMPYLGIKDAKKRVVEFLIGLDTYKISKERDKLRAEKNEIITEWKKIISEINQIANMGSCTVSGISVHPQIMSEKERSNIFVSTINKKTIDEAIVELNRAHDFIKRRQPKVVDNFDELNEELSEIEKTIEELEKKYGECQYQEIISKAAVEQASRSLEIVNRDLRNNKDAVKLQKMGATSGCQISVNICPVCNQSIQDSLLHIGQNVPVMSVEENIRHLEGQKEILEFDINSHKSNIENLTVIQNDIRERLVTLRKLAQTIRSDLFSTETEWSETIVHKLVDIETCIRKYEQVKLQVSMKIDSIMELSASWKINKEEFAKLPNKSISPLDLERMGTFKSNFIKNLRRYKYKSAPDFYAIDIPIDTCLPTIDGFDMKFDSSASDNIRIIWSFTMALLQTSIEMNGNHPRVIIFDEPAQHSIVTSDMESLIKSVLELNDSSQVIMGITLNNEELKNSIEKLQRGTANIIEIGERAFTLFNANGI